MSPFSPRQWFCRQRVSGPGASRLRSAKKLLLPASVLVFLPLAYGGASSKGASPQAEVRLSEQPTTNDANAESPAAAPTAVRLPSSEGDVGASDLPLRIGDRIRLAFYERVDDTQDKWRETRSSGPMFHQFAELCGDFEVQEDGSLSLPILGSFQAKGKDSAALSKLLADTFENVIGRKAFVNFVSIEHQPVYIVGNVKNSAAFRYVKGMTVMHLVALAGGARVSEMESWQLTEGRREISRLKRSLERVKRLLVRTTLLRTEGGYAMPKETISGLVGGKDFETLVNEEGEQRQMDVSGQTAAATSLIAAVNAAREDLNAKLDRLKPLDRLIETRQQREKTLSDLVDRSVVARPALVQSQGELAEVQDRKQTAMIDADAGRSHLADTERALAEHRLQSIVDRDRATASAERDTLDALEDSKEGLTLLTSLEPREAPVENTFEVSRRTGDVTVTLHLRGTDELEPGDLVRVQDEQDH